jgi:hypothetical protein
MLYSILLAAQTATASPAITPDQITALPPSELGRRLLGPTRHPIVEAFLYAEPLEPVVPDAPVVTKVMLYEQARESTETGFCEKVRYLVRLYPVIADKNGNLPPASTNLVTPSTLYRLKTATGTGPACEGRGHNFLSVNDREASGIFSVIRQLAATQSDMQQNKPLRTTGSVDDEYGRQGYPASGMKGPITDWKAAFVLFPTTKIGSYDQGMSADGLEVTFRAEEWTIELTFPNGGSGIGKVLIRRSLAVPA